MGDTTAVTHVMIGGRAVRFGLIVALIAAGYAAFAGLAMRRTSTTFDEIVLVAAGARGYETGDWHMAPEHPPLMQYVYGLPAWLSQPKYPDETGVSEAMRAPMAYRYRYAAAFFFMDANDPEQLTLLGRLPALLFAIGLIVAAAYFARGVAGNAAGVIAALAVACLPDVLAHGGVAYNDVPVALAYFLSIWAVDRAARRPTAKTALAAGLCIGLALGIKTSAVGIAPIAIVLLAMEAAVRFRDRSWWRDLGIATIITLLVAWITLALVYRGDFTLAEYRYALQFEFGHVTEKVTSPAFFLGEKRANGWWYFFPVSFLLKTSAGLHALLAISAIFLAQRVGARPASVLRSRLRAPLVAAIIFGAALLASNLNIGFRYALPMLPFLCVLAAAGAGLLWYEARARTRLLIAAATALLVLHPLSYYPWFLSYVSEYGPGRDRAYELIGDSSLDWGQGLLELRSFMRENGIDNVYLSYFGSAYPAGYGISHVPVASFFPLPQQPAPAAEPAWLAISATNLQGVYFPTDPFAQFRDVKPDAVLAHTMFLYRIR
ncbi:MAG TPA: glycosyltransferase family 39 protein [Longimicrobiales bacterium]